MKIIDLNEIRRVLKYREIIDRMRDALVANARGECDTPMPMHLNIAPEQGEIHVKSSYRRGGKYFALKIASTFPGNIWRGLSTGNGMMLLSSAETGEPVAFLSDAGHLTDVRTAAASAMVARELGRTDRVLGILGTGIQARLQARLHSEILDLQKVVFWGRNRERAQKCAADIGIDAEVVDAPAEVARRAKLIVTATASQTPLLFMADLQPGTHISAVGSDSPGKQELDPTILMQCSVLLVDSRRQCQKLGELQHMPAETERSVEIGTFCESKPGKNRKGLTVCDFTGLGVEDLYIAEYCYEKTQGL